MALFGRFVLHWMGAQTGMPTDPIGPHNRKVSDRGGAQGTWSLPTGDYFEGQGQGGGQGQNPLATPIPAKQGAAGEQAGYGPEAAPLGYTQSGRPRSFPGQEDGDGSTNPNGISQYAPGRVHGPTVNPTLQTPTNPGASTRGGGGNSSRAV